jgi:hypothetical protein
MKRNSLEKDVNIIKKTLSLPHTLVCGLFGGFLDDPKSKKFMDIKKRADINNLKKGIDEEKIYGPACIILLFLYLILLFYDIITLNIFLLVFLLLLWNFFIYFPFHRKPITILTLILVLAPLIIFGFVLMVTAQVKFPSIAYISYFWWVSMIFAFLIESYACKKHKLSEVDLFFGYFKSKFGSWIVLVLAPLSSLVFLAFASTYYFLGGEHIYLWVPVLTFWVISGIRLIKYKVLK